jgi:hypothetical protein
MQYETHNLIIDNPWISRSQKKWLIFCEVWGLLVFVIGSINLSASNPTVQHATLWFVGILLSQYVILALILNSTVIFLIKTCTMKYILYIFFAVLFMNNSKAQTSWTVDKQNILKNGKPLFLNGVNYVPSVNWQTCFENWDASAIEKDFAALEKLGVKCIRWFPLWPYIQPKSNKLDEKAVGQIIELFNLALKHKISVQLSFLSGWMSGFTFLPEWADGNIFTDAKIIEGEKFLITELAGKLKNHQALQGYDFGNELNVLVDLMKLKVTAEQIDHWMQNIYQTIHKTDPYHPVTNGIGTGFNQYFTTPSIAKSCDFMSNHSYPVFHRTTMLDPKIGQRTTYSSNFITSWCKMEGKPVLIQEIGSSESEQEISQIAKFLRITMLSNWADGAAGYFWWASCDINPDYVVPAKGLYLNYSLKDQQNSKLSRFEQSLGLLDSQIKPKVSALEYQRCVEIIDKLGVGWEDKTQVCYVLVPEKHVYDKAMIQLITPFTLLKQNHVLVRLAYETQPIPTDASAIVIAGFELSETGKKNVGTYLNNGGNVYQSFYNDFKKELIRKEPEKETCNPLIWLNERSGSMLAVRNYVKVQNMKIREMKETSSDWILATKMTGNEKPLDWNNGDPVYVKTQVGQGNYFYFAGELEKGLELKYNPWQDDNTYELYAAFCPKHEIFIDNKFVEFYHKKRGEEEIVILINHENIFQDVNLLTHNSIQLIDIKDNKNEFNGTDFYLRLKPAEVKIFLIKKQ